MLACHDARLGRVDSRDQRRVRSLGLRQPPPAGRIDHQQIARSVTLGAASDRNRLRKIRTERPEPTIGENRTVAVNAEDCDTGKGWANVTTQYGTGSTLHTHEPSPFSLCAVGCSNYAN